MNTFLMIATLTINNINYPLDIKYYPTMDACQEHVGKFTQRVDEVKALGVGKISCKAKCYEIIPEVEAKGE